MSHWYTKDGAPCHTVMSAKNEPRATTLRDARKLQLAPSVTTISKEMAAGMMLDEWKLNQLLLAVQRYPGGLPKPIPQDGGAIPTSIHPDQKEWADWCKQESWRSARESAARGNAIHDALNASFTDPDQVPAQFLAHVDGVRDLLAREFGPDRVWRSERTFASMLGFGGSIDLESEDGDEIILDFKCKAFDENKKVTSMVFDEHLIQLGGYSIGRKKPNARTFNVFASTDVPGLCVMHAHSSDDLKQGQEMFLALLHLWQAKHKYKPEWSTQ